MKRDFTATCYVIHEDKVLLIYHKKLKKWLPPGGHMDPNETPAEAACREVLEETGIEIQLVSQENITISRWNAKSIMRPYMCLLEEIPAHGETPAHQHIDFIYLGVPVGGLKSANLTEVEAAHWFTKDEVLALKADSDIFLETQETIVYILTHEMQVAPQ
jgi:8-oxo-dGTP pyrophosphatase MutT (NUDIX family)